jgi:hypothetical protein
MTQTIAQKKKKGLEAIAGVEAGSRSTVQSSEVQGVRWVLRAHHFNGGRREESGGRRWKTVASRVFQSAPGFFFFAEQSARYAPRLNRFYRVLARSSHSRHRAIACPVADGCFCLCCPLPRSPSFVFLIVAPRVLVSSLIPTG